MAKRQTKFNKSEFKKVKRKPVTLDEMREFDGQILSHNAKPDRSEYQEPSAEERGIPLVFACTDQGSE